MHLPALFQFLDGLAENNNRPWFIHNKPSFDILNAEFIELVESVGKRVAKFDKEIGPLDAKKSVFRIYRDVRFAKDKSPYKTHFGAVIGARNMSDKTRPIHYFHIDHTGTLLVAAGIYKPDAGTLKRLRQYIADNPGTVTRLLANKAFAATYGGFADEERLTRPPKGFDAEQPHIEIIKNRHFFCETTINLKKMKKSQDLADLIADRFKEAAPLVAWARKAAKAADA